MKKNNNTKTVLEECKKKIVPVLREKGFTGSFPHFRNIKENQIDLLSIQFDKWGGGYRICVSKCPAQNIKDLLKKDVEPGKTTVWHFGDRYTSDWFRYDNVSEDAIPHVAEKLAEQAIEFLQSAKQYWEGKRVQRQSTWTIFKGKLLDYLFLQTDIRTNHSG